MTLVLREGHHVQKGRRCDVTRRGEGRRRRGCGAHAPRPRLKVTPTRDLVEQVLRRAALLYSVPFTLHARTGTGVAGRGYYLVPGGIYDITLWTPTLLVHHLLSQSSRLTRRIDMRQARDVIRDECEILHLTDKQIKEIMSRLHNDLLKGLGKDTHASATVKCWITYIQDLPNGKERGKFLALDLGGTNFRVLIINLGDNHFDMQSKIYAIPNSIMTGTGIALFDHIAECLANFMKEHGVYEERLALGFTFSFPLKQLGLTKGILQRWTKGFSCSGVVGEDVVQGLRDAISRRGDVQIDICAILNDTTGTLMSCAWKNHNCKIGLIAGTGSNACYVEKTENCEMYDVDTNKDELLINTEWGAFGDDGALDFVRTEFDREVDSASINPGKQLQEKMISGMYLGELVRVALVKFTRMGLLFGGRGSDLLFQRNTFYTKYVSEIESDKPGDYTSCMEVLEELGLSHASEADMAAVRHVCECISRRAAHLVSAGLAVLLNKMGKPEVTVGIDGSVYRFHPHFHALMCEKIAQLVNPGLKFDLMLSEDGSGRGAALVAAVACREAQGL